MSVSELYRDREEMRSSALDVIGLLNACLREDGHAANAMLATHSTDRERAQLTCALLATAVCILRVAASATGTEPGKLLAVAAQEVRDEP